MLQNTHTQAENGQTALRNPVVLRLHVPYDTRVLDHDPIGTERGLAGLHFRHSSVELVCCGHRGKHLVEI